MNQSFLNLRFEQIGKRFNEVEILLNLATKHQKDADIYQALCRSAHVLLVSHFEGLYKEICRDVIDDINQNTIFSEVKSTIFNTHCNFFILSDGLLDTTTKREKAIYNIKLKLKEAFKDYPSQLKCDPFLFVDNKNPTPEILETILEKFGIKNFFWSIDGSDLDLVFEDQKSKTQKLRDRLLWYLQSRTFSYPYTVDSSIYHPVERESEKKKKTLWEDFINNFLHERHNIIHGHVIDNPNNHESLSQAKIKIEIILYAYIINICTVANPLFLLPERSVY